MVETDNYIAINDSDAIFSVHKKDKGPGKPGFYLGDIYMSQSGSYVFSQNKTSYLTEKDMYGIMEMAKAIKAKINK